MTLHLAPAPAAPETPTNGISADKLRSFVGRIERLHEERQAIASDISDVFTEAKSDGFDVKALRKVIAERRIDPAVKAELDAMMDLYREALA